MENLEGLEGQGSLDYTLPIEILEKLKNQDGESVHGDATDLTQTVANPACESQTGPFSR